MSDFYNWMSWSGDNGHFRSKIDVFELKSSVASDLTVSICVFSCTDLKMVYFIVYFNVYYLWCYPWPLLSMQINGRGRSE